MTLLGADDPRAASPQLATYQNAQAKAGKSADAHIRLALWCEAHGLTAERLKHLSLAVLYDPANTLARGLMGLVAYHGKWDRPDVVGQQIQNDPAHQAIVNEYLDRRARTPDKAEAQMKLAAWCEEKGLKEQALAHYSVVTRLDPSREAAWKHLGYKKQGGRWVKPEEAAAAKQEAAAPEAGGQALEAEAGKTARRAGEQGCRQASEGRARAGRGDRPPGGADDLGDVCARRRAAADGGGADAGSDRRARRRRTGWPCWRFSVRRPRCGGARSRRLKRRDPRDVVGRLIGLVHKPYKYQVRHVNGPGSPGELFVEGERFNIQRFYQNQTNTPILNQGRIYTPDVPFDPFSVRNLILATIPSFITTPAADVVPATAPWLHIPFRSRHRVPPWPAQAIAANPQNASAILGQLVNNPGESLCSARLLVFSAAGQRSRPVHAGHARRTRRTGPQLPRPCSRWHSAWQRRTRPRSISFGQPSKTPTTLCIKRRSSIASRTIPRISRLGLPWE